jgi:hypothetical protein
MITTHKEAKELARELVKGIPNTRNKYKQIDGMRETYLMCVSADIADHTNYYNQEVIKQVLTA